MISVVNITNRPITLQADNYAYSGPYNIGVRISRFPHFNSVDVHIKYTSNMAACYHNGVNSVTAPRSYRGTFFDTDK